MPLSPAVSRKRIHTRCIEIQGFQREDGLWDIDGHLTDTKSYDFPNRYRGSVAAGEPLHDMSIRLTVDDAFVIRNVEAISEATPFAICPEATSSYEKLIGLRIAPGWGRELEKRIGKASGCTHLTALLHGAATVAFQTIFPLRHRETLEDPGEKKPPLLNSCYAFASDREVVRERWPRFYTGS